MNEVLVPGLQVAASFDCMVGFFDSKALADLAPGLASYIGSGGDPIRLVISPYVSDEDFEALESGVSTPQAVLERRLLEVLGDGRIDQDALAAHTVLCLAYLLSVGRINIAVALVSRGLFHPKIWLIAESSAVLAAHGSSNFTSAALGINLEQVAVDRSWGDEREKSIVRDLLGFFDGIWTGRSKDTYPSVRVFSLPDAVRSHLLVRRPMTAPTEADFERASSDRRIREHATPYRTGPQNRLAVPPGLDMDSGPFAHQGEAIRAWEAASRRGILAMATGSGKTVTALAAATRLAGETDRLLVVIAVPQRPLLSMWGREVRAFGIEPMLRGEGSASRKLRFTEAALRRLELGVRQHEVLVVTHDLLVSAPFRRTLDSSPVRKLLIADEVHNLGRREFIDSPPEFFEYRLGLSATPERQYDPEGSAALEAFFGPQVFEFGLDRAIGVCLVPFDYFVHLVELSSDELVEWRRLTARIRKLGWASLAGRSDDTVEERRRRLLLQRRRILEDARSKVDGLERVLRASGPDRLRNTLIYATDKEPTQLAGVNALLTRLGVRYHQLTATETSDGSLSDLLLWTFAAGDLQVLTAKRVLDEGVNLPAVRTAHVLASTTVRRQWVQRLGRVLRLDPTTGKDHAEYHDFVAVPRPEDGRDDDARAILRREMERVRFIGQYARNGTARDGWVTAVDAITMTYFG